MRKPIIIGNWKMQLLKSEAEKLISDIKDDLGNLDNKIEVVVCPSFVHLSSVNKLLPKNISLGGQDLYWEDKGAYTGAVSGLQLKDIGCKYVIIGHSERRKKFNENNEDVNKKIRAALENSLMPIVCVGEKKEEREEGRAEDIIREQTEKAVENLNEEDIKKIIFAYEPVWAIGTGVSASEEDAEKIIKFIRNIISEKYNEEISESVRIIYGGSVDLRNIDKYIACKDIDGVLAGGISLKASEFCQIIEIAKKTKNSI